MACRFLAAQWGHKEIELAAHDLFQKLDARRARKPRTIEEVRPLAVAV